ncbi:MAG: hypothetical protein WD768_00280 [Phycisphaeraceae bacterium]
MVAWMGRKREPMRDLRKEMIDETSRFITWALSQDEKVPRIPVRRVEKGGFSQAMKVPGARSMAARLWSRLLDTLPD